MSASSMVLRMDERVMFALRTLYELYGYTPYKVRKFEAYDFYMQNKNFLPSKQILTFHDTNGNLMALKPDITLSIVKNTQAADQMKKVYYTEHVYRAPRNGDGFREILQTGLECIGKIDGYAMGEVIMLAVKSLAMISDRYILDMSHMGVVSGILEKEGACDPARSQILRAIAAKNRHELAEICKNFSISTASQKLLCDLIGLYGPIRQMLNQTQQMALPENSLKALKELEAIQEVLNAFGVQQNINLDFSIVNDMDYYNGVFFRGFIDGLSEGILSGGRYDNLMAKMGKYGGAIGFAVYLDPLERFQVEKNSYDVDAFITYDDTTDLSTLIKTAKAWTDSGKSVRIQRTVDSSLTYRQLIAVTGQEVKILETNA